MYSNPAGLPYKQRTTERGTVNKAAVNPNKPVEISVTTDDFTPNFLAGGDEAYITYNHNLQYIPLLEGEIRVKGTNNYRSIPYRESDAITPDFVLIDTLTETSITILIFIEGGNSDEYELILYLNQEGTNIIN